MSNNPHHPLPQYVVIEDGRARWATRDEVHECRCLTRRLLRSMCDPRRPFDEPDTYVYRSLKRAHNGHEVDA